MGFTVSLMNVWKMVLHGVGFMWVIYTAGFEDGTIWTAPEEEPNKALMEFILRRRDKTVILDEEDDFVV